MFTTTPDMFTTTPDRHILRSRLGVLGLAFALTLGLIGCDGGAVTGTSTNNRTAPVSISVSTESGANANTAAASSGAGTKAAAGSRTFTDSVGNTLRLNNVEIILREIEFDRSDGTENCSSSGTPDEDDDCEKVESGPLLVSLPLSGSTPSVVIDTTLPTGIWKEVEFDVHKLDPTLPADSALLAENDFPSDASIRAQGEFTPAGGSAQSFTFTSDLNAEREIEFSPPVEVTADGTTNITFSVELSTWFRQQDSTLVDPARAGDQGTYENLVEENIETSIEGFEDENQDGEDDESGDDDGGEDDGSDDDGGDDDGNDDDGNDDDGNDDDGDDDDGDDDDGGDDDDDNNDE
ncbi:MAG: hypothetical protein ABEL51_03520 [Salinibacter sp.]